MTAAEQVTLTLEVRQTPFVGRADELLALRVAVDQTPAVALVEGDPGIGKSRLVTEALSAPQFAERLVLQGACQPLREPFPFGPVVDLLRVAGDRLPHDLSPVCGALHPYLPELADQLPPPLTDQPDSRVATHRTFRAVRALLEALGPTVLVIEDVHWADDGTRDLISFLVSDPPAGLALVLTYRRMGTALPLGSAYRPPPHVASVRLELQPLGVEDVRAACEDLAILPTDDAFADELHRQTAGIPLVLEEVLRTMPAGVTGRSSLASLEVPTALCEVILEQVDGLSAFGAAATYAAAILPMPSTTDLISQIMTEACELVGLEAYDLDPDAAVREALAAKMLHEHGPDCYGFRHPLAQQAVYDTLPGPDRQRLHRRALTVLQESPGASLRHLAYHARRAGMTRDWLVYAEEAALSARDRGDIALSVELLEELLRSEDLSEEHRARIALDLSRSAVIGTTHERLIQLLRSVLADGTLAPAVRGEIRLNVGLLLNNQQGRFDEGRADTVRAVHELSGAPAMAARGLAALAMPGWSDESCDEHIRWIERAEALLDDVDDPAVRTAVMGNRLALEVTAGYADCWTAASTFVAQGQDRHDPIQVARTCCNIADGAAFNGHDERAAHFLREGRQLADRHGVDYFQHLATTTELRLDLYAGRWDDLAERAQSAREPLPDSSGVAAESRLVLAELSVAHGDLDQAMAEVDAAGLHDPRNTPAPVLAALSAVAIRVHLASSRPSEAAGEANAALARLRRKRIWTWSGDLAPLAMAAYLRVGDVAAAQRLVRDFGVAIVDRDAPLAATALGLCTAMLDAHRGRRASAASAFRTAHARCLDIGRPYLATRALEGALMADLRAGAGSAESELIDLADTYLELGAVWDAARCRAVLRRLDVSSPSKRGRRGYGDELSPREREVGRLVMRRQTNRQIADALYLSPRTVEQHVAKLMRKQGVRSRTDIRVQDG